MGEGRRVGNAKILVQLLPAPTMHSVSTLSWSWNIQLQTLGTYNHLRFGNCGEVGQRENYAEGVPLGVRSKKLGEGRGVGNKKLPAPTLHFVPTLCWSWNIQLQSKVAASKTWSIEHFAPKWGLHYRLVYISLLHDCIENKIKSFIVPMARNNLCQCSSPCIFNY